MEKTINSERYAETLNRTVVPLVTERRYRDVVCQPDDASVHFSVIARNLLNNKLPNKWRKISNKTRIFFDFILYSTLMQQDELHTLFEITHTLNQWFSNFFKCYAFERRQWMGLFCTDACLIKLHF